MNIRKSLLESGRGTTSNLIFYYRNGTHCVRIKPAKVRNPNTPYQKQARNAFAETIRIYQKLQLIIKNYFISYEKNKKAYHKFISANYLKSIFSNNIINAQIQLTAKNNYKTTFNIQKSTSSENTFIINNPQANNNIASASDNLNLVLTNNNITDVLMFKNIYKRQKNEITITADEHIKHKYPHLYYFFASENLVYIEDTQYLDLTTL